MDNYYSVTEYSRITGKDPGNIRRMLIDGRLAGEKLGNQWVIKTGTEYPKDARVSTGKYLGWRKRVQFRADNKRLIPALDQLVSSIAEICGDHIDRIILYGSYARGTQTSESDIDIALLLNQGLTDEMQEQITDLLVDLELEYDIVLSVVPILSDDYAAWGDRLPFYKNIRKEGIILWNAV